MAIIDLGTIKTKNGYEEIRWDYERDLVMYTKAAEERPLRHAGMRYPVLPEVWQEIQEEAKQFGPLGPEFIRAVMEAMQATDSQWEAIMKGRQRFLSGGLQRFEKDQKMRGPWHHPPTRLKAAVDRLQALCEGAHDEEEIVEAVTDIAKEFDAEGLKDVAREFGIEKGLSSKGQTCRLICDKIGRACRKKEKHQRLPEIGSLWRYGGHDVTGEKRDKIGEFTAGGNKGFVSARAKHKLPAQEGHAAMATQAQEAHQAVQEAFQAAGSPGFDLQGTLAALDQHFGTGGKSAKVNHRDLAKIADSIGARPAFDSLDSTIASIKQAIVRKARSSQQHLPEIGSLQPPNR